MTGGWLHVGCGHGGPYLSATVDNSICFPEIFIGGEGWKQAAVASSTAIIWFIYNQGSAAGCSKRIDSYFAD